MDPGIAGRTELIAGGSAGLGRAAAAALAREGADLFVSARGADFLEVTATQLRQETGASVTSVVADHGAEAGPAVLLSVCPAPDILIITYSPPPLVDDYRAVSADRWRETFEMTVIGSIELMRHFASGMAERGFGRIVNIRTIAAKHPLSLRMLSGTSRAAVANYAAGLSRAVARHGVTINSLLPGIFETPGLEQTFIDAAERGGTSLEDERARFLGRMHIPAARYGDPEEVGALCAILCSRQAGYLAGQSIFVDGGLGGGPRTCWCDLC